VKRTYYKLVGHEVVTTNDLMDWIQWVETADVQVDISETADFQVSTVFLNTDLSCTGEVPTLFETMVFCRESYFDRIPEGQSLDHQQFRYSGYSSRTVERHS
jgi:hypothetical protein